ncbi:hypothetical protein ACTI_67790 [Actinoplanes sp. OR16]|nr:hypothetical protein ACTI_67790 [Actinoplanes sp. OR16]
MLISLLSIEVRTDVDAAPDKQKGPKLMSFALAVAEVCASAGGPRPAGMGAPQNPVTVVTGSECALTSGIRQP